MTSQLKLIDVPSAWKGLEGFVGALLIARQIPRDTFLEFGVEYGYSIAAISNWFESCIGVDTFLGDAMSGHKRYHLGETEKNLRDFKNITLLPMPYQDFIATEKPTAGVPGLWDFVHVDISHDYKSTHELGSWAVNNATATIFHDVTTFPQVRAACEDIAHDYGLEFETLTPEHNGLGLIMGRGK